jgi:hypothetical protein
LYAYLGARRSEALRLQWDNFAGDHVLLSGKNKKQRLTPVGKELSTILRLYKRSGGNYDGYLFPPAIRLDDAGNISRRFDAFLRAAGIPKAGRSTHSLRHSYAGIMTATGEPTALLQAYMGHSNSDMTIYYAQMATRYRQGVADWGRGDFQLLRSTDIVPANGHLRVGKWSQNDQEWLATNWSLPIREIEAYLGRNRAAIYKYARVHLGLKRRND